MSLSLAQAADVLNANGQSHVLFFRDHLSAAQLEELLAQVASIDFGILSAMRQTLHNASGTARPADIVPADVLPVSSLADPACRQAGEEALRAGRVGTILVAGGQATRLGFDRPKGTYPLGPISGASLFEIHAGKILALEQKYNAPLHWYIMTSPTNRNATISFFELHCYFGLSRDHVQFFTQGSCPALWPDGRIVMDRPDHIFISPDGHGGTIAALHHSGMIEHMRKSQVDTLFYFQVDNPLVEIASPPFVGLHLLQKAEMSVKVCAKRDASEGLGVAVMRSGRPSIVEYTELTDEQKHATTPDGNLRFRYGSVAIHILSLDFLIREVEAGLPLHCAHKKVPYCDESGNTVQPDQPNAYKFEKFIFDALPDAKRTAFVEFRREEEFSPLKNATGNDSADSVRRDIIRKYALWLEKCGVTVPRDFHGDPAWRIEIMSRFASDSDELKRKLPPEFNLSGDLLLR